MSRQIRYARDAENLETCLLDLLPPSATLPAAQMSELAELVALLLREIAVTLANGEVGDDEDHG
jgi:hypothetical protein